MAEGIKEKLEIVFAMKKQSSNNAFRCSMKCSCVLLDLYLEVHASFALEDKPAENLPKKQQLQQFHTLLKVLTQDTFI